MIIIKLAAINLKIGEEAFSIEQVHFTKTSKKVNPKKQTPFKFWEGSIPVLISAPHAVRHERKKKIKVSDEFTGSIAYLLNKLAGCHALATTKLYGGDPNYDFPCIYKDAINNICSQHNILLVLDLHGASRDHVFDVDIGTMRGESLLGKNQLIENFKIAFNKFGLTKISQDHFPGIVQNTVTKYVSRELGIPSFQLEINRKYRVPHHNPESYSRLISALVEGVKMQNFGNY